MAPLTKAQIAKLTKEEKREELYAYLCENVENYHLSTPSLVDDTNSVLGYYDLSPAEKAEIIADVVNDNRGVKEAASYLEELNKIKNKLPSPKTKEHEVEDCYSLVVQSKEIYQLLDAQQNRQSDQKSALAKAEELLKSDREKGISNKLYLERDKANDKIRHTITTLGSEIADNIEKIGLLQKKLKKFSKEEIASAEKEVEKAATKKTEKLGKRENRPSQDFSHYKESGIYTYEPDSSPRYEGRGNSESIKATDYKDYSKRSDKTSDFVIDHSEYHDHDPRTIGQKKGDTKTFKVGFKNADLKATRDEIARLSNKSDAPITPGIALHEEGDFIAKPAQTHTLPISTPLLSTKEQKLFDQLSKHIIKHQDPNDRTALDTNKVVDAAKKMKLSNLEVINVINAMQTDDNFAPLIKQKSSTAIGLSHIKSEAQANIVKERLKDLNITSHNDKNAPPPRRVITSMNKGGRRP